MEYWEREGFEAFHSRPSSLIIFPIEQVSCVKSLWVHIDENVMWHFHIDKLCKKITSAIEAIKRVKLFVPQSTLLCIYNSLIQPLFDYYRLVWGGSGKT